MHHTLIIFSSGSGTLSINDKLYFAAEGKCFLLTPNSVMELIDIDKNRFSFYKLTFSAIQIEQQVPTTFKEELFSNQIEYAVYPYNRFIRLADELNKLQESEGTLDHFKQQGQFYALLGILFEHQLETVHPQDASKAVEQTIEYIHQNYRQSLTVKHLANLAHVAQWQYSTIFQTLTGQKPLDFLTDIRMMHAKELLQQTEEPLRDFAQLVGFNDEYYFNRRFRQVVGIPPKQFARLGKQKIFVKDWTGHEVEIPSFPRRIIYHGETFGDLLVFGIQPIGGNKTDIDKSFYKNHVHYVQDVAFPFNIEKSSILKPDLIIFTNADEQQYQKIAAIAPTVTHNSWGTLEERISILGQWLGKKQQAEDWLAHFIRKESTMWKRLQPTIQEGETASVFIFDHGRRLFVMGGTGLPSTLYHPLGFQPGELIEKIIANGLGYQEITVELLTDYAGDRIFMLLPEGMESKLATEELMNSPLWHSLPAVKSGHAYLVDGSKWNYSDAFTREKLLGVLPLLLENLS